MEIELKGWDKLIAKMGPKLLSKPVTDFFNRSGISLVNLARVKAPVDTGLLRSSIAHEVEKAQVPSWAKVGSKLHYAPYMEYGTGTMSDAPGAHGGAHWPPGAALNLWASRHGFASGAQVAAIIGLHGGLRPRRFLRNAFQDGRSAIMGFARQMLADIRKEWER